MHGFFASFISRLFFWSSALHLLRWSLEFSLQGMTESQKPIKSRLKLVRDLAMVSGGGGSLRDKILRKKYSATLQGQDVEADAHDDSV